MNEQRLSFPAAFRASIGVLGLLLLLSAFRGGLCLPTSRCSRQLRRSSVPTQGVSLLLRSRRLRASRDVAARTTRCCFFRFGCNFQPGLQV